jgi:hypothetical protein
MLNILVIQNKNSNQYKNNFKIEEKLWIEILTKIQIALQAKSLICGFIYFYNDKLESLADDYINKKLTIAARMLKYILNFKNYEKNIKFLKECLQKYPKKPIFYEFLGCMLCFSK